MASVHIRVAAGFRFGEQHTGDDQSGGQFIAFRGQGATRSRNGFGAQLGLQGGKNCGLYFFDIFIPT
jgi:hypothetical protein